MWIVVYVCVCAVVCDRWCVCTGVSVWACGRVLACVIVCLVCWLSVWLRVSACACLLSLAFPVLCRAVYKNAIDYHCSALSFIVLFSRGKTGYREWDYINAALCSSLLVLL